MVRLIRLNETIRWQQLHRLVPAQPLQHHRDEFQGEDGGVEHHAPGHLEHHGVGVPVNERMPDAPGLPQIKHQGGDHEEVAQEPREDRGPLLEAPALGPVEDEV